jgi:PAS domain S-box-containing protein
MIWLTGDDGAAIYVNPHWSTVTGQSCDEALGAGWLNAIHPDDRPAAITAFTQANADQLPCHICYRIRQIDGTERKVRATSYPLFDSSGRYIGYVGSNSLRSESVGQSARAEKVSHASVLSSRERSVLTWVAAGLTADEIADKLGIASRTVEFHIHSAARKLNSSNRVQTVVKAAVSGEIDLTAAIGQ